jgi:hypothetical protein
MTSTLPRPASSEAPDSEARGIASTLADLGFDDRRLTPEELERAAGSVAGRPELWSHLVVDSPEERWWIVLYRSDAYEVRLLSWEFDQSSGWHDHGGSSGGFVVTSGVLRERCRGSDLVSIEEHHFNAGDHGSFGPDHLHDVAHETGQPAVSVHAYSPPLERLTMYDPTRYGFVVREVVPDDSRSGGS